MTDGLTLQDFLKALLSEGVSWYLPSFSDGSREKPWRRRVQTETDAAEGTRLKDSLRFSQPPHVLFCLFTSSDEVGQQSAPLGPELVGSGQTAVASDHTQVGDAQLHQVASCHHAALSGAEVLAAGAANDCASLTRKEEKLLLIQLSNITP